MNIVNTDESARTHILTCALTVRSGSIQFFSYLGMIFHNIGRSCSCRQATVGWQLCSPYLQLVGQVEKFLFAAIMRSKSQDTILSVYAGDEFFRAKSLRSLPVIAILCKRVILFAALFCYIIPTCVAYIPTCITRYILVYISMYMLRCIVTCVTYLSVIYRIPSVAHPWLSPSAQSHLPTL